MFAASLFSLLPFSLLSFFVSRKSKKKEVVEVLAMQQDRVNFFVQLEKGKRSFMLRVVDVNERKVALMAAMDRFYLVDASTSDPAAKKPIVAGSDGSFPTLIPGHTYQVFRGTIYTCIFNQCFLALN